MGVVARRFEVHLVNLDPTIGSEIRKTRPCVVISSDDINGALRTVIVAPMTTKMRDYPTRASCVFQEKRGQIALDQIRPVDQSRLVSRIGKLSSATASEVLGLLQEMFAE